MPGGPELPTIRGAVVDGDGPDTPNGRMAHPDVRGRRRLLLVALAGAGIGLLLTRTPSPARAAPARAAPAQASSGRCGSAAGSEGVFSFTPGTKTAVRNQPAGVRDRTCDGDLRRGSDGGVGRPWAVRLRRDRVLGARRSRRPEPVRLRASRPAPYRGDDAPRGCRGSGAVGRTALTADRGHDLMQRSRPQPRRVLLAARPRPSGDGQP
jgi:hypothetical protein